MMTKYAAQDMQNFENLSIRYSYYRHKAVVYVSRLKMYEAVRDISHCDDSRALRTSI
jgi:hypothetical protein